MFVLLKYASLYLYIYYTVKGNETVFVHLLFLNLHPTQILLVLTQPFKQSIYWGSPFMVWMLNFYYVYKTFNFVYNVNLWVNFI